MRTGSMASRNSWAGWAVAVLVPLVLLACQPNARREQSAAASSRDSGSDAPYQAEVEEGLGAALAILIDTSGSMRDRAPGDSRPKHVVAQQALEAMLDATDAFIARRPDFPIKIGVYSFSSSVRTLQSIQPYDRKVIRATLANLPSPGGGTAIGDAMSSQTARTRTAATPRRSHARSGARAKGASRPISSPSTPPLRSLHFSRTSAATSSAREPAPSCAPLSMASIRARFSQRRSAANGNPPGNNS
jgi:hypothetical protein